MKRFLPYLAIVALFLPAVPTVRGEDVSLNFFYENLNGGNWYEVADYGYVWQPEAAGNTNWRPYTDGYWAYTDQGWTWVSYEDFGWATYHYGRWANLDDYGWCWVPGYEWGPSWVSWRTGGDYIGWAPLPPARPREEVGYDTRPITPQVDVQFGIGPAYYNFVDLRYIGEPVLRERIIPYAQNVTYIQRTVNVTNITYNNSIVYNYGPDFATVSRYSTRPIPRLTIQRETINPMQAVRSGNVTKVQGDRLLLAAPQRIERAQGRQLAPTKVKAKIAQPKFEKGWAGVKNQAEKQRLEQQFKTENAKNVPEPDLRPNAAASPDAQAVAPAGPAKTQNASGAARNSNGNSEARSNRNGKGKRKEQNALAQPAASVDPESTTPQNAGERANGKNGKHRAERAQAQPSEAARGLAPTQPQQSGPGKERGQNKSRGEEKPQNRPAASADTSAAENAMRTDAQRGPGKHKGEKRERAVQTPAVVVPATPVPTTAGRGQNGPNPAQASQGLANDPGAERPTAKARSNPGEAQQGKEKGKGKKKNKGEPQDAPNP
ncbi:MAG: DUF6600 domain-containing protein [Verrucomicrobiota bacterium]